MAERLRHRAKRDDDVIGILDPRQAAVIPRRRALHALKIAKHPIGRIKVGADDPRPGIARLFQISRDHLEPGRHAALELAHRQDLAIQRVGVLALGGLAIGGEGVAGVVVGAHEVGGVDPLRLGPQVGMLRQGGQEGRGLFGVRRQMPERAEREVQRRGRA